MVWVDTTESVGKASGYRDSRIGEGSRCGEPISPSDIEPYRDGDKVRLVFDGAQYREYQTKGR